MTSYERFVNEESVLLDAGCGREAPVINQLVDQIGMGIGVDLTEFNKENIGKRVRLLECDLEKLSIRDASVDIVISRSVLEHLKKPSVVFNEISRILKGGGHFIFLVPNSKDYVSTLSRLIPNKLHGSIISKVEGRMEQDTFHTFYRANSFKKISRLAAVNKFDMVSSEYISQYPSSFSFSAALFYIASIYDQMINKIRSLDFLKGWILVILRKKSESPQIHRGKGGVEKYLMGMKDGLAPNEEWVSENDKSWKESYCVVRCKKISILNFKMANRKPALKMYKK